ncbi:MAG: hypothetical protein A2083_00040 [Gemmatimonadetes bacterium GWC2_71_9]|nr:MAG: hypothetical protein A2083_00040 [Gemmatimonadetes bacterium GWC2_71_9]OGT95808.1 MAG: hypothetical protein A3I79_01900 [Gemmatimonadetes bacterium RIFCSPLOWO2_02_FULL_71_11]
MDNSYGVIGVAPGVQGQNTYSWRVVRDDGTFDWGAYLSGINNAPILGVKTVLVEIASYGDYWQAEGTAIASAWAQGTIVVAGVGNRAEYWATVYPASVNNVVGVSGVRDDGSFAVSTPGCTQLPGSNWGPMVDLAAPYWATTTIPFQGGGGGYYDTQWLYGWCSTELSAAHVAGVVALLWHRYPSWTPSQIVGRLTSTASRAGSRNDSLGYGVPHAANALTPPPPPLTGVSIDGPRYVTQYSTCTWIADASGGQPPYTYQWFLDGSPAGTDGSFTYTASTLSFRLEVWVNDAGGGGGSSQLTVDIDPNAEPCLQ